MPGFQTPHSTADEGGFPHWNDHGDPMASSRALGPRNTARITWGALALATIAHAGFVVWGATIPLHMRHWVEDAQHQIHDYLWATYDIQLPEPPTAPEKSEPDKPSPDESEPLAPVVPPPPRTQAAPKQPPAPPPAAAKAGKILSAPEQPDDEPVDLTGEGFVTGNGDQYVGGVTAAAGTGSTATYNPAASPTGKPGGTGTSSAAPSRPPPPVRDLSRPATVTAGSNWSSCPFPEEADMDQVDYAVVTLIVAVRPDGTPRSVRVVRDPGHGFGRAARLCALSMRYVPALNRAGAPTSGSTPPINVRFTR